MKAMREMGCLTAAALPLLLIFQVLSPIPCQDAYTIGVDDLKCLQAVKNSVEDPEGHLATWRFSNSTPGLICNFLGIKCWHPDENRVLGIELSGMGLGGQFPLGLHYCGSMTAMDLSANKLSGTLPPDICEQIPFLVTLDLSENNFTGSIPAGLHKCTYANIIRLNDNRLSGEIPWQLSRLDRLRKLDVADNRLSGPIPSFLNCTDPSLFQNNRGLCGPPLKAHCTHSFPGKPVNPRLVAVFALYGALAIFWLGLALRLWRSRAGHKGALPAPSSRDTELGNWTNRIRTRRSQEVFLFEKPIRKMTLADLLAASDNFNEEVVIWWGRTGTIYRASLPDGSLLAVTRLGAHSRTLKEFKSEMNSLARFRHRNLLPLLGYSVAGQEKLLVYKYMANGTLFRCLHSVGAGHILDWPTRFKISLGIARGLAWLHHTCNPPIIHRNICSGIVFLDEEYEPRIGGLGLAGLMNVQDDRLLISRNDDNLEEEFGYDAPEEWRNPGVATLKGDVYRFGVVLLELVTGVRPVRPIVARDEWIRDLLSRAERLEEAVHDCVDERRQLSDDYEIELVVNMIRLAGECVNWNPAERPSMYRAYESLKNVCGRDGTPGDDVGIPLLLHVG